MASKHIQSIIAGLTLPPVARDTPVWFQDFVRLFAMGLSQQVQLLATSFEAQNVVVTPGAGNVVVTWTTPAPIADYIVIATPNWSTTCYYSALALASAQINFGTVAPANAAVNVLRVR